MKKGIITIWFFIFHALIFWIPEFFKKKIPRLWKKNMFITSVTSKSVGRTKRA